MYHDPNVACFSFSRLQKYFLFILMFSSRICVVNLIVIKMFLLLFIASSEIMVYQTIISITVINHVIII